MSADAAFRCPVCRARQTLRGECRRCRADLSLVVRARGRAEFLRKELKHARGRDDYARARDLAAELQWLAPNQSAAYPAGD